MLTCFISQATWTWCVVFTLIHSNQKLFSIGNNNKCNWQIMFASGNNIALFSNNETVSISLLIKAYKLKKKPTVVEYICYDSSWIIVRTHTQNLNSLVISPRMTQLCVNLMHSAERSVRQQKTIIFLWLGPYWFLYPSLFSRWSMNIYRIHFHLVPICSRTDIETNCQPTMSMNISLKMEKWKWLFSQKDPLEIRARDRSCN